MYVSEDHCNKNMAEKQNISFRTSLHTWNGITPSGDIFVDQGREWIVMIEDQASSK